MSDDQNQIVRNRTVEIAQSEYADELYDKYPQATRDWIARNYDTGGLDLLRFDKRQYYGDRVYEARTKSVGLRSSLLDVPVEPHVPATEYIEGLQLTDRQSDIASLLMQGHTQTEIADMLSVSVSTVNEHTQAIRGSIDPTGCRQTHEPPVDGTQCNKRDPFTRES